MIRLATFVLVLLTASSAHAQLFGWRPSCYQQQAAQQEIANLRYQQLADQQRMQFEIMRLQTQQQPAIAAAPMLQAAPAPSVNQEIVIYLVQPAQPQQVVPQIVPQTIPYPVDRPVPQVLPVQPAPQPILIGASPIQQLPGGAPQQQLPGGAPQQQLPGGAPQQQLPGGGPIQQLPGGSPVNPLPGGQPVIPKTQPLPGGGGQVLPGGSPQTPSGYQTFTRNQWRGVTSRALHR